MKHYNPTITENAFRIFNLKGEPLDEVMPYIQPTKELGNVVNIVRGASITASNTSTTLYTTPSDKDFYLTGFNISVAKDAACDVATSSHTLRVVMFGANQSLALIPVITLTAERAETSADFPVPIKIDRNTIISFLSGAHTAGLFNRGVTIRGYTVETTKGV